MRINDFEGNFRQIEGFDDYLVSDIGTVYSVRTDRLLSPADRGNGHLFVTLSKDGKRINKYIHALVAEAFIDKPDNAKVVHHLDHNKRNNNVINLCWMTDSDHKTLHTKVRDVPGRPRIKLLCHQNNEVYTSMNDAAKDLGVCVSQISLYLNGMCKSVKGYTFEKVEDYYED